MRVLAGDVGGTKTWLALYEVGNTGFKELAREKYASRDFPSLAPMIRAFCGADRPDRAVVAVAGPVVNDTCRATNLPWELDARALERELGIHRVRLLNDFHAAALGIPSLSADETVTLQEGEVDPKGPVAVIGAGTGLGQAVLLPMVETPFVLPSEGGHTDFAPRNELEIALLRFLLARHQRVSYERVLSGRGLAALYDFVVEQKLAPARAEVQAAMREVDPAQVIGEHAMARTDPACEEAARLFAAVYGAESGNLALQVLPTGGLFLVGGIAPKLLDVLQGGAFMEAFLSKGRLSPLLAAMRVCVVTNTRVGLLGALAFAGPTR